MTVVYMNTITVLDILFIEFIVFSILGWCMEVTLKYLQFHRFINRGFLIGPYCPVYGFGVVIVTVVVGGAIGYTGTLGDTFLAGFALCGALEYFTSWLLEHLFHARWWDYSNKPMNLNGRIWIGNLILFGCASVVIILWISPLFFRYLQLIDANVLRIFCVILLTLFLFDAAVSYFLMNLIKQSIDKSERDNTEAISQEVTHLLHDKHLLYRRIIEAYPSFQAHPQKLLDQYKQTKTDFKVARRKLKIIVKSMKSETNELSRQQLVDSYLYAKQHFEQMRSKLSDVEKSLKRDTSNLLGEINDDFFKKNRN